MTHYPGVHRKGPGRGHIYRWREIDPATGKVTKRTSVEFSSAAKAAADRSNNLRRLTLAKVALRNPTREGQSIEGAWRQHPSTVREPAERTARYAKMLAAFTKEVGYTELRRLAYADVADWVQTLRERGLAWPTRCHYLLPLRRAAKMAPTLGLPDVLAELKIDERPDEQQQVQAWTFEQLVKAWVGLAGNLRARVALALGGFAGLRPSEIYRIRNGFIDAEGRLAIGVKRGEVVTAAEVKNRPSRRLLPLPQVVLDDVRSLIGTRGPDEYLITTSKGKASGPFNEVTFAEWLGPILEAKTGRDLSPKFLRKTFATWTAAIGLDFFEVEMYLGRETPMTKSITSKHYLADVYMLISRRLDPLAARITTELAKAISAEITKANGGQSGGQQALVAPAGPPAPPEAINNPGHLAIR